MQAHAQRKRKKRKKACARAGQTLNKNHKRCCAGLVLGGGSVCVSPSPPSPCSVCASGCPFTSVQAAVAAASPGATITICPGVYTGNITINKNLALIGAGDEANPAAGTILNGGGVSRVIDIGAGLTVAIHGVRITGGAASGNGGGIRNFGISTLVDCTVVANTAISGGGIVNGGQLTLQGCDVRENTASAYGGGIWNRPAAHVTLTDSKVQFNHAVVDGGGILNAETVTCDDENTVTGNTVGSPEAVSNCINGFLASGCTTCSP